MLSNDGLAIESIWTMNLFVANSAAEKYYSVPNYIAFLYPPPSYRTGTTSQTGAVVWTALTGKYESTCDS
jgi:hypothetical protein